MPVAMTGGRSEPIQPDQYSDGTAGTPRTRLPRALTDGPTENRSDTQRLSNTENVPERPSARIDLRRTSTSKSLSHKTAHRPQPIPHLVARAKRSRTSHSANEPNDHLPPAIQRSSHTQRDDDRQPTAATRSIRSVGFRLTENNFRYPPDGD